MASIFMPTELIYVNGEITKGKIMLVAETECMANHGYTRQAKGKGLSQANRSYDFKHNPFFGLHQWGDKQTLRTQTVALSPSVIQLLWE